MAGFDSNCKVLMHFQNRVWTFAGTAQIDTAQSKFGAGSLLLNGSTDYISTPNSADFDMGDSDFTVDFWVRFGTVTECTFVDNGSGNYGLRIFIESNTLKATIYYDTGFAINFSGAWTPSTDTWYHIALVRNGATTTLYADGVVVASDSSQSMRTPNSAFVVGRNGPDDNGYVNGWIDEVRITKGLARWTADFSASLPTAKYADDVQDPILGTWNPSDKSASVTLSNGNLTATNAGASWSSARSTVGKSSGKWYWEYTIASLGYVEVGAGIATSALDGRFVNPWGTGWGGQSNTAGFGAGDVVQVAIDIDGGNIWVGKNGTWNGSGNPSTGANPYQTGVSGTIYPMVTVYAAESTVNLGASTFQYQPPVGFNGLHTVSLLHFDEADGSTYTKDSAANWSMDGATQFYDESGKVWTASGNAQLDTAQYKWTASGLFDGDGDYISTPDHDDFAFGSGDFTIDLWARLARTSGIQILVAQRADVDNRWNLFLNFSAAQGLGFYWKPTESYLVQGSNAGWSTGTWYHIAVTRNGNEFKIYRDGTALATATLSGALPDLNALVYVGGTADGMFAGHIDELRISKGIARWIANFTPPTDEYSVDFSLFETGAAEATFEASLSLEAVVTEDGEAADLFTAGYYYEKTNTEAAESSASVLVETRVTQTVPAQATADLSAVYWVVIQQYNIDLQLPYLEARTGYNCWAEPTAWLPTLEAYTGGQLDSTLQFPTLSSDVFVSPIVDGAARLPLPTLSATITMEGLCFLAKSMKIPSISATAYFTGTNELDETLQFIELYATAVNSRSFSTYVLEYTR